MQLYTAPAILIELQYLNRYLNMVRVSMVTICQGMHSNLGDLPSTPSSYACPINTKNSCELTSVRNTRARARNNVAKGSVLYVSLFRQTRIYTTGTPKQKTVAFPRD